MRFKGVEPGMVVYTPKPDEAFELMILLDGVGYTWSKDHEKLVPHSHYDWNGELTAYWINDDHTILVGNVNCAPDKDKVIRLSDLMEEETKGDDDLISREELLKQFRSYVNRSFLGEATADTELKIGEIASIIKNVPSVSNNQSSKEEQASTNHEMALTDHEMTLGANDVLKWLKIYDQTKEMGDLFTYSYVESVIDNFSTEEIIRRITEFEKENRRKKDERSE